MDNGDNGASGMHDSFLTAGGQYIVHAEGLCFVYLKVSREVVSVFLPLITSELSTYHDLYSNIDCYLVKFLHLFFG